MSDATALFVTYHLVNIMFDLGLGETISVMEHNDTTSQVHTDVHTSPSLVALLQYLVNLLREVFVFPFLVLGTLNARSLQRS